MRVAGNKIKHIHAFFHSELNDVYPVAEIEAMLSIAVEQVLGFSKTDMYKNPDENINQSALLILYNCAKDLKKQIPLQYILGKTVFYNLPFIVNKHTLIPRPETEELVDLILKENKTITTLLDIGTGSGCIPISLKKHLPSCHTEACDISEDALRVAKQNAGLNQADICFFQTDILMEFPLGQKTNSSFDVIVSNPPYIQETEKAQMDINVTEHEPHLALFVESSDAVVFYKKIIDLCADRLNRNGKLYFELNPLTASEVKAYAEKSGLFENIVLIKDMSGAVRFFKGIKN